MKFQSKLFLFLGIITLTLIVAVSCRKSTYNDDAIENESSFSTKDARKYFYDVLRKKPGATISNQKNRLYPYWHFAYEGKTDKYSFIEVPVAGEKMQSYTLSRPSDLVADKQATIQKLNGSFTRLVIYKDKKGAIGQRIITYMPDTDYLKKHNYDASHNQTNNWIKILTVI